ncbi:MAG: protein kinase [Archangium sp.]|nr:protein kinase [Archangium sp.]
MRVPDPLTSSSASVSLETATLLGRLRGTRGLWLFVLLAAIAPVSTWLQWRVVRAEMNAPDIGLDIQRNAQRVALVAAFDATRWPTVHPGDAIETLNGEPVNTQNFWTHRVAVAPGLVRGTFLHEGVRFEASAPTRAPSAGLGFAYVTRLMTGALLLLIALGAFLLRPGGAVNWLFLLFLFGVGHLTMMTAGFIEQSNVLYLIIYSLLALTPGVGLLLLSVFPRPLAVPRAALVAVAGLAVLFALSHLFRAVVLGSESPSLPFELATRAWAALASLVLVVGQAVHARRARKRGEPRLAALYRTLVLASGLGLFAPVVLSGINRALKLDGSVVMEFSSTAVLIFAVLTAVVLVRHNPLAIDRYATSVVGYVITVGGLGLVFGFTLLALPLVLNRFGLTQSSEALVLVTASLSISVGPVYRRLRGRIDRFFSEEQANLMQTAAVLRSVVDAVQQKSQGEALAAIVEAARVLGGEAVAFWQLDATGKSLHLSRASGVTPPLTTLAREGSALVLLEKAGGVAGLSVHPLVPLAQQTLWSLGLALSAPVRAHGVAVGFFGLGRRPSGFSFRAEDQMFLEALASQLGLALERGDVVTNIGRYRVERRLATGGMAEVFIAWQLGPGGFERKVALKRLLPELAEDPQHAASLLDEARIAARLSHRNVAQVFEVGLEQGQHFIAMEFVDGPPLRSLMAASRKRSAHVPLPIWLQLSQALLSALEHAHTVKDAQGKPMGVVHRDVTPANVLVAKTGEAKLVDFGLVLANTRLFRTQTGIARGTLPYMSPEQAAGELVDCRSDIYSATASLYELLTLARAFPEGPYVGPRPEKVSKVRAGVPAALDEAFDRGFALDKAQRPASAEAFSVELTRAAGVTPASEAEVAAWVQGLLADVGELKPRSEEATRSVEAATAPARRQ